MKLPQFAIDYLLKVHKKAKKSPYYHLGGYMDRAWILGARSPERNNDNPRWKRKGFVPPKSSWLYRMLCRMVCIRAHTTFRSDSDRHLHDHPAWNISIVLQGGYWEVGDPGEMAEIFPVSYEQDIAFAGFCGGDAAESWTLHDLAEFNIRWRGPGSIVFRRAKTPHRLILPPNTVCKSIFIQGWRCNDWGFIVDGKKVGWKEYLGVK